MKTRKLLEKIKNLNVFFKETQNKDVFIIDFSTDDEKLYEICSELSEYIMSTDVSERIIYVLNREYRCFNADEKAMVLSYALKNDEFSELTGRIYIYLKHNGSINPSGFYFFMCNDINRRLYDIVCEGADRVMSLNDGEDFISLLRYFSSVSPISCDRADIIADGSGVRLLIPSTDKNDFSVEFADMELQSEEALSELVMLNPNQIVVHGKEAFDKSYTSEIIYAVFGEKVLICTGCNMCKKNDI